MFGRSLPGQGVLTVRVIVKTTDPVLLSYVETLLTDADIAYHVADRHVSAIEAWNGAFPVRVMVADDAYDDAMGMLRAEGLESSLLS